MNEKIIKILIAEDHTVVRKGLTALLSNRKYGIEVVGEAKDGAEAIRLTQELRPDIVLMDLKMPNVDGLEAIGQIKNVWSDAQIVVLTSFSEDENISQAINRGAKGFLFKDSSPDELVHALRSVYDGQLTLPQAYMQNLIHKEYVLDKDENEQCILTAREIDVIREISHGLSNAQIAIKLTVSKTTVRTHISNMLRKLDLENRTQLAIYARDQGL